MSVEGTEKKGPRRRKKKKHKPEDWKDGVGAPQRKKLAGERRRSRPWKIWGYFANHYQKTCKGKIKHAKVEEALDHIAGLREAGDTSTTLGYYECQYCGQYHVGHERKNWSNSSTGEVRGDGGKRKWRKRKRKSAEAGKGLGTGAGPNEDLDTDEYGDLLPPESA